MDTTERFQIQRILHPTDFSDCVEHATTLAVRLAVAAGAELHVLHVVQGRAEYASDAMLSQADEDALGVRLREAVRPQLEALPAGEWESLDVQYEVAKGRHTAPAVVEHARRTASDLIVLGTHGRRGLRHLLLGSVAEEIIRSTLCPVLTVRCRGEEATSSIRQILVPVDFSRHAEEALGQARALAVLFEAQLTLLFVAEEHLVPNFNDTGIPTFSVVRVDPEIVSNAGDALRQLAERTPGPDVRFACEVRTGDPGEVIVDVAEDVDADLIVMATRGLRGVEKGLLGSVTERVVRAAPCPVWTQRAREASDEPRATADTSAG